MNDTRNYYDRTRRRRYSEYFKRMWHYSHMDFEYALWIMVNLWKDPFKVHNIYTKFRKRMNILGLYIYLFILSETKNQWARDDPAFVVLFAFFILMSNVAWGIAFQSSFGAFLLQLLGSLIIDFFMFSIIIASMTWAYSNKFLISSNNTDIQPFDDHRVEWLYAFDIHCNAYFTMFLYTHIIQFLLSPLYIYYSNWFVTLISNMIYSFAIGLYFYTTSHGFTGIVFR